MEHDNVFPVCLRIAHVDSSSRVATTIYVRRFLSPRSYPRLCHRGRYAEGYLPYIDIPVVSIVWTYSGLTPDDMESG